MGLKHNIPRSKRFPPLEQLSSRIWGRGRKIRSNTLVKADDITVVKLPLVLQGAGTGFRNETVHIPLDANFRLVENPADLVDDVIPNRLLTEVKDQLIPAEDRLLLRCRTAYSGCSW